jgi:hypothetical protein
MEFLSENVGEPISEKKDYQEPTPQQQHPNISKEKWHDPYKSNYLIN